MKNSLASQWQVTRLRLEHLDERVAPSATSNHLADDLEIFSLTQVVENAVERLDTSARHGHNGSDKASEARDEKVERNELKQAKHEIEEAEREFKKIEKAIEVEEKEAKQEVKEFRKVEKAVEVEEKEAKQAQKIEEAKSEDEPTHKPTVATSGTNTVAAVAAAEVATVRDAVALAVAEVKHAVKPIPAHGHEDTGSESNSSADRSSGAEDTSPDSVGGPVRASLAVGVASAEVAANPRVAARATAQIQADQPTIAGDAPTSAAGQGAADNRGPLATTPDGRPPASDMLLLFISEDTGAETTAVPGAPEGPAAVEVLPEAPATTETRATFPVVMPAVQAVELMARFVPFDPAALDASVQRFLDGLNLQKLEKDGFSFSRQLVMWTAAGMVATSLVSGELVRRKKLPLKTPRFLSRSRLFSGARTV